MTHDLTERLLNQHHGQLPHNRSFFVGGVVMGFNDFCLISATFLGPIAAVQAQQWLERWRESRNRRLQVFKTLMGTRGAALSPDHVQALNSIDLEFQGKGFAPIRTAWKVYRDHLNRFPNPPEGHPFDQPAVDAWVARRIDLLSKLLMAMGASLGHPFDEVDIKHGAYVPAGYESKAAMQTQLLETAIGTFSGRVPLKMDVVKILGDERFGGSSARPPNAAS